MRDRPIITSRQNPLVKRLHEAIRTHRDEIVIEGPRQVADAIAAGWTPLAVVTRGDLDPRGERALRSIPHAIRHTFAPDVFALVADARTPQDILALFERPRATVDDILPPVDSIAVALDAVQDPGNVGTIIRLAAAFDCSGVLLLPGCADPLGPKAIRASAGAVLNVPFANVTAAQLIECGVPLLAAEGSGSPVDPPARGAVIVFGNEGVGPGEQIVRAASAIAIPMSSRVESLNVASSAAILLARSYALRQ